MSSTKHFFVHSHALCESENIGKDTRVWAFAHILPGATLGSECNVCDNVFIENDVIIGDRVSLPIFSDSHSAWLWTKKCLVLLIVVTRSV